MQKHFVLLFVLFGINGALLAQKKQKDSTLYIGKGVTVVGGSLFYNGNSGLSGFHDSRHTLGITASAHHFVSKNIAVGGLLTATYGVVLMNGSKTSQHYSIGAGPSVRFYHLLTRHFGFFEQARVTGAYGRGFDTPQVLMVNSVQGELRVSPGFVFLPVRRIAIDLFLGGPFLRYNRQWTSAGASQNLDYGFAFLQGSGIGVNYFVGR